MGHQVTHTFKHRSFRRFSLIILFGLAAFSWGFPWDQDMVDQAPVKAQEAPRPGDTGAVLLPVVRPYPHRLLKKACLRPRKPLLPWPIQSQ